MGIALDLYENDFFAWTQEQAKLIKKKAFDKLDITNLLEEVISMGKHEKRELASRLDVLLMHLLKWKYQPSHRVVSWELSIKEQRRQIYYHLEDNPSLKSPKHLKATFERAYEIALYEAAKETKLSYNAFPKVCEWTIAQVLDDNFLPH
jgi:hypothetical protein